MPIVSPETELQRFVPRRRLVTLDAIVPRGENMVRCWFVGNDLEDFESPNATDHIKLQVPDESGHLAEPERDAQHGRILNREQLGLRDMTPRIVEPHRVAIDIVRHPGGVIGNWLGRARVGDRCAFLGPRGSKRLIQPLDRLIAIVDLAALPAAERRFNELGLPGVLHLVGAGGGDIDVPETVTVEVYEPGDWTRVTDALQPAIANAERTLVWAAGEATGVARVRASLRSIEEAGILAQFNGYWRQGVSEYDHHAELPAVSPA